MLKEFKNFVMRGNVVDMAVGVIIGAAFGKIVSSLVSDVLLPPIGKLTGGVDFSNLYFNLTPTAYDSLAQAQQELEMSEGFDVGLEMSGAGSALRAMIDRTGRPIRLEVDGGVKADNIGEIAAAGADTFVAGSAIFREPRTRQAYAATIAAMRGAVAAVR